MTIQQAHDAFGEKSYGEDTSANTRNGAIGVGGKDAFYGMEDVFIISIHKGIPILIELRTNKDSIIECKELALKHGIKFTLCASNRFKISKSTVIGSVVLERILDTLGLVFFSI